MLMSRSSSIRPALEEVWVIAHGRRKIILRKKSPKKYPQKFTRKFQGNFLEKSPEKYPENDPKK